MAGTYEQYCNDYAVSGCPMRDAMEYEENARYDCFDGYREDADLIARQAQWEWEAECDYHDFLEYQDRVGWEASFSDADNEDASDARDRINEVDALVCAAIVRLAYGLEDDVRSGESYNLPHTD